MVDDGSAGFGPVYEAAESFAPAPDQGQAFPAYGYPSASGPAPGFAAFGNVPPAFGPAGFVPPAFGPAGFGQPAPLFGPASHSPLSVTGYYPGMAPLGGHAKPPSGRTGVGLAVGILSILGLITLVTVLVGISHSTTSSARSANAASHSSAGRTLTAPESAAGFTKLHNTESEQTVASERARLQARLKPGANPQIGVYTKTAGTDTPAFAYVGMTDNDIDFAGADPDDIADGFMRGAGVQDATEYSAGNLGGELQCGTAEQAGHDLVICVWVDDSTLGSLIFLDGTSPSDAGVTTQNFRNAVEH